MISPAFAWLCVGVAIAAGQPEAGHEGNVLGTDITLSVLPEHDSQLSRVFVANGRIVSSTRGIGQSCFNGSLGEAPAAGQAVSELVALGADGDFREENGWDNLSPRLVTVAQGRYYIINLMCGPSFPAMDPSVMVPADVMTENVLAFDADERSIRNLTKLDLESSLCAGAIAWFDAEAALLVLVTDVDRATGIQSSMPGTGRAQCLDLHGIEVGPVEAFPRIEGFYEAWSSTAVVGLRDGGAKTRWFLTRNNTRAAIFEQRPDELEAPVAFPLTLDARMIVTGARGHGTWLVSLGEEPEVRKISEADLLSVDPLGGTIVMRTGGSFTEDGRVWLAGLHDMIGEGYFDCPPAAPLRVQYERSNK